MRSKIEINKIVNFRGKKVFRFKLETMPAPVKMRSGEMEWRNHRRFVLVLDFGRGAGYIWGRSFFLARDSGSAEWYRNFRGGDYINRVLFGFEAGFTQNANRVPYLPH